MNIELLVKDLTNLIAIEKAIGALGTDSVLMNIVSTTRLQGQFNLNGLKSEHYQDCINEIRESLSNLYKAELCNLGVTDE